MDGSVPSWCWVESAAREKLEAIVWMRGAVCPHCGEEERLYSLKGTSHRSGLYKCGRCRRQFTATVGTVFHGSHVPLDKWFLAIHLLYVKKPPASIREIERWLGISYKTAWALAQRLKEANLDRVDDFDDMLRRLCPGKGRAARDGRGADT